MDSQRDWGFAGEYVEAMWLMLQADRAEDFVLATGQPYSVRQFCEFCAQACEVDLQWSACGDQELGQDSKTGRLYVESSLSRKRAHDSKSLVGQPAKALARLGWRALTHAPQLAALMVENELKAQVAS